MLMPGDVVTALFIHSDASGRKVRPALVVSSEDFNQETRHVILAAISTKPVKDRFDVMLEKWKEAGLRFPSKVRVGKLVTVDARLVRKIGSLVPGEAIKSLALARTIIARPESMTGSD